MSVPFARISVFHELRIGVTSSDGCFYDIIGNLHCNTYNLVNLIVQDSMDLFVGNYVVHPEEGMTCESPLAPRQLETRYVALPLLLLLSLAMLTLSLILPAELSTEILLSALFWAGLSTLNCKILTSIEI